MSVNSKNKTADDISRRKFIKGAAATSAAFIVVPRHVIGGAGFIAPSDKLNIAGVGIGGMGKNNIRACADENIVALCDVDQDYAAKVYEQYPDARFEKGGLNKNQPISPRNPNKDKYLEAGRQLDNP